MKAYNKTDNAGQRYFMHAITYTKQPSARADNLEQVVFIDLGMREIGRLMLATTDKWLAEMSQRLLPKLVAYHRMVIAILIREEADGIRSVLPLLIVIRIFGEFADFNGANWQSSETKSTPSI